MSVVPRNEPVKAARKIRDTMHPQAPKRRNVRRPKRSTVRAVTVFPMIVKLVRHALRSRGM